ncbi:hypothetical protein K431DRAFT_292688 [Polychaeton citri CBS 116435]|uniref:HCP-like protein n=1 Tax=Polychaeton citri CBS 116435 TaxID=1314669 RepID=A0A9P4QE77_9PEZI|nr:hypothetical protein K431DRAFT_292688 [Polychaeton citri CBS 116435]
MPQKKPPGALDLSKERDQFGFLPPRPPFIRDLPSPRTGEVPPALSPLDAFAQHSRMLAAKFEAEAQKGRRISRLQPDVVSRELANRPDYFRSISGGSQENDLADVQEEERPGTRGEVSAAPWASRPISHYPRLSNGTAQDVPPIPTPYYDAPERKPQEEMNGQTQPEDYFGIPRASSPDQLDPRFNVEAPSPLIPSLTSSVDSVQSRQSSHPRTWTNGSSKSQRLDGVGLAPPKSPAHPRSPRSMQSIRSVRSNSGDDETSSVNGQPQSRKFSASSSGMSRPQSPFSPWVQPVDRSPSVTSSSSIAASQPLPRPSFNFSRPLSAHGQRPSIDHRPSFDTRPSFDSRTSFETGPSIERLPTQEQLYRHPSAASQASTGTQPSIISTHSRQASQFDAPALPFANPALDTPSVVDSAGGDYFYSIVNAVKDVPEVSESQTSTHLQSILPRGRSVRRTSAERRTSWIHNQFNWDEPNTESFRLPERPVLPMKQHSGDSYRSAQSTQSALARVPPAEPERPSTPSKVEVQSERQGRDRAMSSANRSRSADPRSMHPHQHHEHAHRVPRPAYAERQHQKGAASIQSDSTGRTDSTDRTIKPSPLLHQRTASSELSPEEHLEIGIQAHSTNELNKSTYHLRLASRAGLPTAMLLYALACRHGWGMRANQEEGVAWLRKAIESSQLELADVDKTLTRASRSSFNTTNPAAEAAERRKRKAQLTHAIYELGQSYVNGWGCTKDTALGLQCYEIAGSWGDADALAEAGYCYTKGIGKKKDLKKAASLYRQAAEAGVSMAGNSWIYKPKYMQEPPVSASAASSPHITEFRRVGTPTHTDFRDLAAATAERNSKQATRSRTRSIWGRKK